MSLSKVKEAHKESVTYNMAKTGGRYYNSMNDIKDRKMYIYTESGLIEDPYKANNKIASAFYKMLVDQKVNYLLSKKPDTMIENNQFYFQLKDVAEMASAKGIAWVQPYVQDGEFKTEEIPAEELYPVYDNGNLVIMYRFYMYDKQDYTEVYTTDTVTIYKGDELIEERGHIKVITTVGTEETITYESWGKVPFIPMKNNNKCIYDLQPIKSLIDNYDVVISDFANNLEDFQDVTWILKGFNGNLAKFTEQVKMYKAVPVANDGEVKPETFEVPHVARMSMIEKLESLIFKFGFGVNTDQLTGSSLTNVAIKSAFSNLDMKATAFSQEVEKYIREYIEFYNIYASKNNKQQIPSEEIKFNKSIIVNETEVIETILKQQGFRATEQLLREHPTVDDVETELIKLAEQYGMQIQDNPVPTPNEGETEEVFMKRCTTFLINEGTDTERAVQICSMQWGDVNEPSEE